MKRLLTLVCLLTGCSSPTPDMMMPPPAGPSHSDPVLVGAPANSSFESEPSIAVAPDGTIAIVWLDLTTNNAVSVGSSFSVDHGVTWSPPTMLSLQNRFASNEIIVADAQSNFYLVSLGVKYDTSGSSVFIAKSPAGANKFASFRELSDPSLDAIRDASAFSIAQDGSFNVVYNEVVGQGITMDSYIAAARSSDAGATWSWTRLTPSDQHASWPNICTSTTSNHVAAVYVDWQSIVTGMRWSDDGGATWPEQNTNMVPIPTFAGEFPSCFTRGDDLWVMQGVANVIPSTTLEPTLTDIELTHSADRGTTLDNTVAAQDPMAGGHYMRPLGVLEADNSISLTYYAGTGDGDTMATVRNSVSRDGGKTFAPSMTLYSPIVLTTSRAGNDWLGDLLGAVVSPGGTYVSFVDNASGDAHIRFTSVTE